MPRKCAYSLCENSYEEISMFRFPIHDTGRLVLWIRNSGNTYLDCLTNGELQNRFICAAHFKPSDIHIGKIRSRLIGPAVPIPFQVKDGDCDTSKKTLELDDAGGDLPPSPEILKVKTPTKIYERQKNYSMTSSTEDVVETENITVAPYIGMTYTNRLSRKCKFEGPKRRLSRKCLFEIKTDDSPERKRLKMHASALLKKNEAQRSTIARLRAKSKSSKKRFYEEDFRSEVSKTIALMQIKKRNSKWSKEEKELCLSLYYKSPAAYKFLKRQEIMLASISTIRRWLSSSSCFPGLNNSVFSKLEKKFEHSSLKEKACVISFDEMAIMCNLEYSKKHDCIEGFEDLGGNRRTDKVAKNALVFMVRGLYAKWQLPLAYFLSASNVKADSLILLLRAVIHKLFDHGLIPKAIVCDQATTNQMVYKKLGITSQYPFFYCNEKKLFAFFDVPHLIKSIRNNLLNHNYYSDTKEISFQDVIKTYEIDKKSTVSRSLTKLTDRHINPNSFQRMTVSLASQILSHSVAAAIKTAKATGQLQSETAEATANFILVVNNWFDALNSRQKYDKNPYKHALSKKSTLAINAINEAKNIFLNLKKKTCTTKKGERVEVLTRPPCFDGVVLSCEAAVQLFEEEISDSSTKYILTYKLNQDVLENLFSTFRQKGGNNRNPTAKLLRTIFRSTFINSLIKLPKNKNCESDEGTYTNISNDNKDEIDTFEFMEKHQSNPLSVFSSPLPVGNVVEVTTTCTTDNGDSPNVASPAKAATLEQCSLVYFAGYLAKVCLKKYNCEHCSKKLCKDIDLTDKQQLLILNKAYNSNNINLKMPSDNLLMLVSMAIYSFNTNFKKIVHSCKIRQRLYQTVISHLKCEAPQLLTFSCEDHLSHMINHMILVKIFFFVKTKNKLLVYREIFTQN